jgi:hypothetical protein
MINFRMVRLNGPFGAGSLLVLARTLVLEVKVERTVSMSLNGIQLLTAKRFRALPTWNPS